MASNSTHDPVVELQQQVLALHRSVAGLRSLVLLFGLGLVLATTRHWIGDGVARASTQDKDAMDITCRRLKIVDDQGKVRLHLTYDKLGGVIHVNNAEGKKVAAVEADQDGGFLSVLGHDGKERAFVGVGDKQSGGLIYLRDPQGKSRVNLLVYQDGNGALSFRNADGKQEAFYGVSSKGFGGLINLNGPDGKARVILDSDKDGRGAVEIISADGKRELFLGASAKGWGGLLNVNGPNGTTGIVLDIDEKGMGRLNLRNKDATRFFFAGADEEGGTMQVYGFDGKLRGFIGVGDKQSGGVLYLMNPDNNKARIVLGIDDAGVGFGEGRDAGGAKRRMMR